MYIPIDIWVAQQPPHLHTILIVREVLQLQHLHGSGWKVSNINALESVTCVPKWETEGGWHGQYNI
jgi:hypothetical protein